ncbi:flagellin [Pseudorhizobium endolithicum]|uniref:Flagellin n=1 Tax=Pseudorhizobium endolithicum TaxID=1191678 RepID=A0ABN7JRK1_9HYPH|nr:flagellin [Pseudorhizobium endolithicum]
MTSILTNNSAMAALQTLRAVANSLGETQQRVSTGLRVGTATDNAAYWSISTTMRSDNMALAAVSDALGLGAAKVDTASSGTESVVDLLKVFKARLVTATEDGVDRSKVQAELSQLNEQAESIILSSSFSGVNWLRTNVSAHLMEAGDLPASVVSSFVRSETGNVAVEAITLDLKSISMLNVGGGGILQKELGGIGDIGGFRGTSFTSNAHNGHEVRTFTGPAEFGPTDYVEFEIVLDAGDHSGGVAFTGLRIDKGVIDSALGNNDGKINNAVQMRAVLQRVFDDNLVPAWTTKPTGHTSFTSNDDPARFEIGTKEGSGHPGSSIEIRNVSSDFNGVFPSGFALGLENPADLGLEHDNMYPKATLEFTEPFTISGNAEIYFDVQIGTGPVQAITVSKATVDAALGTTDGVVSDRHQFAAVIAHATTGTGLTASSTDPEFSGKVVFMADQTIHPEAGLRAKAVSIGNVRTNIPWTLEFDLAEVDITNSKFAISEYLRGVEYMLQRAISSASGLGSLKSRIDLQYGFTEKLMANIDKGIGRLVDADMNEESSRLKALQTQEQLALQSLSIANSNSESIMQLFR